MLMRVSIQVCTRPLSRMHTRMFSKSVDVDLKVKVKQLNERIKEVQKLQPQDASTINKLKEMEQRIKVGEKKVTVLSLLEFVQSRRIVK